MTGITRVSKESIFSDLNHLRVVTTTSDKYATAFGFTEEEVFAALDEAGLSNEKEEVKYWYDGFCFGEHRDIYNPWSILNFLCEEEYAPYWANTSTNSLVGKLLREGNRDIKEKFEALLKGENIQTPIDEQIVYNQIDNNEAAVWSLLLASGYLKVLGRQTGPQYGARRLYTLALTNFETKCMFEGMVSEWFGRVATDYNDFIKAILADDTDKKLWFCFSRQRGIDRLIKIRKESLWRFEMPSKTLFFCRNFFWCTCRKENRVNFYE